MICSHYFHTTKVAFFTFLVSHLFQQKTAFLSEIAGGLALWVMEVEELDYLLSETKALNNGWVTGRADICLYFAYEDIFYTIII